MQRRLRREDDVGSLPSLGQADSQRSPPRVLRFKETSPQQPAAAVAARRASRLPELVRRESIISTYRSELYQPRVVTFVKNGDRFFEGVKVNVSSRNFRHWEVLLSELSRFIGLPAGVRNIYTPETGHRVTNLDQFQHQRVYVCASTEPFKKIGYTKVKTPTWHASTKVRRTTGTLLDLSRSIQAGGERDRALFTSSQVQGGGTDCLHSQGLAWGDRKRKTGCARKLSFAALQPVEGERQTESIPSQPRRRQSSIAPPNPPQPAQFTVICSGPPPRKVVTVFLDRQHLTSWEQAQALISESLPGSNGLLRLYSVDGVEVESLSQLWATNRVLISAGDGTHLLHGIEGTTAMDGGQQVITEQEKMPAAEEKQTADEQQEDMPCGNQSQSSYVPEPADKERELQTISPGEDGRGERSSEEEEAGRERERHNEENGVVREGQADGQVPKTRKIDISETTWSSMAPTPALISPAEPGDRPHPPPEPDSEIHPTNSLLTLTEDGSFLGCGSPLTVDKVAAIQHLHKLALQYDIDHVSTSGSEDIQLSLASRPSVLCPQTPQSNISFNQPRSLVEMIMPRENGFNGGGSVGSTSSSSRHSSQPKSRTVGIQTDLIGDKLSAIIEEDEQPPYLGMSHKKRRATHPLFHTQTSITSQLNAGQSPRDSYRVGPVVAEGRFSAVRDCHHKVTGRQHSLRVISKAGVFGHEDLISRECELLRGLNHDNLVRLVDGWETSDDICMVAEHIEGTDLFDAVLHCRHLCEVDVTHAMRQLSMALVYLHAHKIVHRDVKLENIFLHQAGDGRWSLKLGGMGLAATASEPLSLVCGNIFYMAPEMIAETGYGTKLDVWAAGVICCTLLSGIMPFGSNSKRATVSNVRKGKYSFLSPFWDDVSDEAKDFVRHLLVVSPSQRYMATQMLQHPWLERERWEAQRDSELSRVLMEHLDSKAATGKNAALPTLVETALDKRKSLPNIALLKRTSLKIQKKNS